MNCRMGKLKEIDKFDGQFFGIMQTMGDAVDPHSRILLETTYEAIIDSGKFLSLTRAHNFVPSRYLPMLSRLISQIIDQSSRY